MKIKDMLLAPKEIGDLEWTETPSVPDNYMADFSFVDDYPKEIQVILKAQLQKLADLKYPNGSPVVLIRDERQEYEPYTPNVVSPKKMLQAGFIKSTPLSEVLKEADNG